MSKHFRKKIKQTLTNASLRNALENLGSTYPEARARAYEGVDFEALRDRIKEIKNFAIGDIAALAGSFEEKIRQRGGHFYRAKVGRDVIEIIKNIAEKRGARTCVKSKSMTSEEIHLNKHLADTMRMVETDLGEWLVQQIDEKPSHIVMPAIHLTREKCAEIFSRTVGREVKPDIDEMVGLARKILRARFLQADIGISGCNIAVAETGTMVILTNEGNGRLTATLPPVHIVLLGYEKLLPKFKDIAPIVNALPKSATGQVITSYITMISGPAETMEAGGTRNRIVPKELHVILLDNGRLQMLKDPVFKEAGRCIRCASCLNVCPVYQLLSGQVYGFIYSGGIGSLLTAFLNSRKEAEKIEALCLNCGHCREVCPAKIDIPGLTLQMRAQLRRDFPPPFLQRFITGKIVPAKRVFHTSLRAAAPVSRLISSPAEDGNPYIKRLPFGLKHMVNWRFLPALAGKPFRDIFKTMRQDIAAPRRGRIAFYAGCLVDYVYPEIGESIVHVLNREGFEVFFPEQTCCGAPAFYTGLPRAAGKSTRRNLESLAAGNFDYIVTPCPTCTVRLRRYGDETAGTDPLVKTQAEAVAVKTFDFIELLHKLKKQPGGEPKAKAGEKIKITYHYSCHLKRSSGIFREPRELLSAIRGIEWVEMEEADRCCGFAGTYSMKFPEISSELLKRKIKKIVASGAKLVVVDCPGCLLSLRGGLESQNIPVRACHSASLFRSLKI